MPGKLVEKPVPSVANVANAPLDLQLHNLCRMQMEGTYIPMIPCGW
jgi:hypothetical protein